jgi:RNA polymerase I-specific transcription initiation factor RRN7
LPNPPPAEPYFYLQETQVDAQTSSQKAVVPDASLVQIPPDGGNTSQEEDELKELGSSESPSEDEDDPEMAELLRENSASGSSDDDDNVLDPALKPSTGRIGKTGPSNRYDLPVSNIAILLLACWTMRIPVICADFRKSVILAMCPSCRLMSSQDYRIARIAIPRPYSITSHKHDITFDEIHYPEVIASCE